MQRASPCAHQAQLRALELDELDAGLIQISRRGGGGAMAELHAFGQHALAVARAAVADCERCAAAHAVRELRSRGRALLLGLPAAAAYAAVAQQSQTRRRLGTHRSRRPMKAARLLRAARSGPRRQGARRSLEEERLWRRSAARPNSPRPLRPAVRAHVA